MISDLKDQPKLLDEQLLQKPAESPLLFELSTHLHWSGLTDPASQIYIATSQAPPKLPEILFLTLIASLANSSYSRNTGGLVPRKAGASDSIDGSALSAGYACLFQQYPDWVAEMFIGYVGQFVRSYTEVNRCVLGLELFSLSVDLPTKLDPFYLLT